MFFGRLDLRSILRAMFGIPFPETQVVGHDVPDEPFVEETAQFLNAFFRPGLPAPEKFGDLRPKFFV